MRAAGALRRQIPADAAASQLGKAGRPAFPLLPGDGAQPTPGPLVKIAQHRRGLAEAEVAAPSDEIGGRLFDDLREAFASSTARPSKRGDHAANAHLTMLASTEDTHSSDNVRQVEYWFPHFETPGQEYF